MTGFFFCLASAEGAGLLFCPAAIQPPYKRLQWLLYHLCSYTVHATKQRTGLYRSFSCDCARSTAYDTRPEQAAIISPAPRWSVSQRHSTSSAYQIPTPRRTLYRSAQPPYYNKVYKGAAVRPMLWIHAGRCSIPQTIPARRGQLLPSADRWQVLHPAHLLGSASPPVQCKPGGMGAAARNHWRLPPHLFSGCRPIANKGQQ